MRRDIGGGSGSSRGDGSGGDKDSDGGSSGDVSGGGSGGGGEDSGGDGLDNKRKKNSANQHTLRSVSLSTFSCCAKNKRVAVCIQSYSTCFSSKKKKEKAFDVEATAGCLISRIADKPTNRPINKPTKQPK